MENPEISESAEEVLLFYPGDFTEENDLYDQNEDDYDFDEDESYDDGIAGSSKQDEDWEYGYEDDSDELTNQETGSSAFQQEIEDSLQETEDYDAIDD
ncbi:hypothetical protein [Spirochaeta isovalerica]|uniref:Uncharacterized protein n=1 Tax=Spirochaeta isovalerica TaxID=150 RepID=A0A841R5C5_9SPIO|nr:hypothetical protein [Spirochaeta isovalerica]MBB6479026.1 hypothetical protein [Spirochaeta isovalerica]